jgi:dTDP-4-amino-4,6-dideoxygalactose transaminase
VLPDRSAGHARGDRRRANAGQTLDHSGAGAAAPMSREGVDHALRTLRDERDRIRAALSEARIGNGVYYMPPLHLQPALRFLGWEA